MTNNSCPVKEIEGPFMGWTLFTMFKEKINTIEDILVLIHINLKEMASTSVLMLEMIMTRTISMGTDLPSIDKETS